MASSLHCLTPSAVAHKECKRILLPHCGIFTVSAEFSLLLFMLTHRKRSHHLWDSSVAKKRGIFWGSSMRGKGRDACCLAPVWSPAMFRPLKGSKFPRSLLFIISGIHGASHITGKFPSELDGSSFVWLQACPFPMYSGSAFWGTLETGAATEIAHNFSVKEGNVHSW